jgi:hypothetical protein
MHKFKALAGPLLLPTIWEVERSPCDSSHAASSSNGGTYATAAPAPDAATKKMHKPKGQTSEAQDPKETKNMHACTYRYAFISSIKFGDSNDWVP